MEPRKKNVANNFTNRNKTKFHSTRSKNEKITPEEEHKHSIPKAQDQGVQAVANPRSLQKDEMDYNKILVFFGLTNFIIQNAIKDSIATIVKQNNKEKPIKKECSVIELPSEEKLLEFLGENLKHCNSAKLYERSSDLSGISKQFKSKTQKFLSPILCQSCSMLIVPISLECGHSTSMCCIKKQIRKLGKENYSEGYLRLFRKCSCSICHRNYSFREIMQYAKEELNETLFDIKKKCEKCQKEMPLFTHYWTELPCLDLCCNCYMDSIVNHSSSCEFCNLPLTNKEVTLKRLGKCNLCQETNYMPFHLRVNFEGSTLCLQNLADLGSHSQELSWFMPVTCVKCKSQHNFFDTYTAPCCKVPFCRSCISIRCETCNEPLSKLSISKKKCCKAFTTSPDFPNLKCSCFDPLSNESD